MAAKKAYESRAEAELAEYSTWRAKLPIYHEGTVVYQPGHPVPVSNVELYKYDEQGLVERVRGEEKAQAQAALPTVTADDNE